MDKDDNLITATAIMASPLPKECLREAMAELFGKATGCKGKGGSMRALIKKIDFLEDMELLEDKLVLAQELRLPISTTKPTV